MTGFGRLAIVGAVGCGLLSGCGGASQPTTSRPTTVNPTGFQACLERKGYDVAPIQPGTSAQADPSGVLTTALGAITGARGYVQDSEVMATPGSSGQGYSVIAFFDRSGDAATTVTAMRQHVQSSRGQVTAERASNVVWFAWQDTARTNEDVSACAH